MYKVKINKRALNDVQKALDYYDSIDKKIGDKFLKNFEKMVSLLSENPFFQVRYADVRCLLIAGFPYMLHFQVNEEKKLVIIRAVINTSRDPKKSWV